MDFPQENQSFDNFQALEIQKNFCEKVKNLVFLDNSDLEPETNFDNKKIFSIQIECLSPFPHFLSFGKDFEKRIFYQNFQNLLYFFPLETIKKLLEDHQLVKLIHQRYAGSYFFRMYLEYFFLVLIQIKIVFLFFLFCSNVLSILSFSVHLLLL